MRLIPKQIHNDKIIYDYNLQPTYYNKNHDPAQANITLPIHGQYAGTEIFSDIPNYNLSPVTVQGDKLDKQAKLALKRKHAEKRNMTLEEYEDFVKNNWFHNSNYSVEQFREQDWKHIPHISGDYTTIIDENKNTIGTIPLDANNWRILNKNRDLRYYPDSEPFSYSYYNRMRGYNIPKGMSLEEAATITGLGPKQMEATTRMIDPATNIGAITRMINGKPANWLTGANRGMGELFPSLTPGQEFTANFGTGFLLGGGVSNFNNLIKGGKQAITNGAQYLTNKGSQLINRGGVYTNPALRTTQSITNGFSSASIPYNTLLTLLDDPNYAYLKNHKFLQQAIDRAKQQFMTYPGAAEKTLYVSKNNPMYKALISAAQETNIYSG